VVAGRPLGAALLMDVSEAIRSSILEKIPGAQIDVAGSGGGHFTIEVVSPVFEGKNRLESQRLVLGAIAHLMKGDGAPVHAVDTLKTRAK
jgi:acid stress-induced BolA-like protein IbaG/YrbA